LGSLLSVNDIKKLFNKCVGELKQEPFENETLYALSGLFDILSDTTGKLVWSAVRPFMALLASEVSELNRVMPLMYGVIDEKIRQKELGEIKGLVDECASILAEIRDELCSDKYDSSKILECLGKLDKIYLKLIHKRLRLTQIIEVIRPIPPPPE